MIPLPIESIGGDWVVGNFYNRALNSSGITNGRLSAGGEPTTTFDTGAGSFLGTW